MIKSSNKLNVLLYIALVALSVSHAFCDTCPAWLLNTEGEFPENEYVRAVGSGTNEKACRDDAISAISLYFDTKTDVVSSYVSEMSEIARDGKNQSSDSETFKKDVKISSASEFFCTSFTQSYYDKKEDKYYCLAYINKRDAAAIYASRISFLIESISSYQKLALGEMEPFVLVSVFHKETVLANLAVQYIKNLVTLYPDESSRYKETLSKLSCIPNDFAATKKNMTFSIFMVQEEKIYDPIFTSCSKVLENTGFVYSIKDASYKVVISVSCIEESYDAGPFIRPSVEVVVLNSEGEGVYSYSKAYPRTGAKTMDKAYTRALFKIQKDFEENLFLEYR